MLIRTHSEFSFSFFQERPDLMVNGQLLIVNYEWRTDNEKQITIRYPLPVIRYLV